MTKGKFLFTTTIKDYKDNGSDVEFSVYGIFDTRKVHWDYYVISHLKTGSGGVVLTPDMCSFRQQADHDSIRKSGKSFSTKEEGIAFIQEYKDKWEYATNDTRQEKRDKKIDDILDETSGA